MQHRNLCCGPCNTNTARARREGEDRSKDLKVVSTGCRPWPIYTSAAAFSFSERFWFRGEERKKGRPLPYGPSSVTLTPLDGATDSSGLLRCPIQWQPPRLVFWPKHAPISIIVHGTSVFSCGTWSSLFHHLRVTFKTQITIVIHWHQLYSFIVGSYNIEHRMFFFCCRNDWNSGKFLHFNKRKSF
jgi:hypothetical protein